jgi:SAM-dependent methyltransferase
MRSSGRCRSVEYTSADRYKGQFLLTFVLLAIAVVLVISIMWPQSRGAPWLPTPMLMVDKMLKMARVGPGDVVYDLGCGDGRFIIAAALRYGARAVGIEIDPLRYAWCRALTTVLGLRRRIRVIHGDFFAQDLSEADVVICYLLQGTNTKLQGKFQAELRPGTRVVSNYFKFPKLRLTGQDDEDQLYVYDVD